jgi:hypothetical protein
MNDDARKATIRLYELLRLHQQAISDLMLAMTAMVRGLKETDPKFSGPYEKHLQQLKDGKEHKQNLELISELDSIIRRLRVN